MFLELMQLKTMMATVIRSAGINMVKTYAHTVEEALTLEKSNISVPVQPSWAVF